MSEKKNIDRLFQEKLKDFEQKPSDLVWENINKELQKDNRTTRVVPLWLRISSIAAVLVLFFIIGRSFVNNEEIPTDNTIVDNENNPNNSDTNSKEESTSNKGSENIKKSNDIILDADDFGNTTNTAHTKKKNTIHSNSSVANNHLNNNSSSSNITTESLSSENKENVAVTLNNNNKEGNTTTPFNQGDNLSNTSGLIQNNDALANTTNSSQNNRTKNDGVKKSNLIQNDLFSNSNEGIANTNDNDLNNPLENSSQNKKSSILASDNNVILNNDSNTTVANASQKNNGTEKSANEVQNELLNINSENYTNEGIANTNSKNNTTNGVSETPSTVKNNLINTEQIDAAFNNKSASDVVAVAKANDSIQNNAKNEVLAETLADNDSIAKSIAENAIEKAIAEQEKNENDDDEEEEGIGKRWSVAPSIAPVYYNTLSSGSPIDNQFASNDKRGALNMSYGVNVGYKITDKLSVRSGINKFDVGYKTDNVVVRPSLSGSDNGTLKNVRLRDGATNLAIFGESSFNVSELPSDLALRFDAFLDQQISYYEVPMEMSYLISDKRLGVNIIGGFSTLFLNDNAIYAQQPSGTRILLGEANNLNSVSFSTNIGVGFNYKISKSFNFNLEPVFKYQLNSFSENSGGFKPYTLGIYSGFSFKF